MKCLNCNEDIKPTIKDPLINCINYMVVLVTCKKCKATNSVAFGTPTVVSVEKREKRL